MKKQTIIEKVKVVNHDKFTELIQISIWLGVFIITITEIILMIMRASTLLDYYSFPKMNFNIYTLIITFLVIFILKYIFGSYQYLKEETTEKIEKEVWIK